MGDQFRHPPLTVEAFRAKGSALWLPMKKGNAFREVLSSMLL